MVNSSTSTPSTTTSARSSSSSGRTSPTPGGCAQRARVRQAPGREGWDRVHRAGQRVRRARPSDDVVAVQAICDGLSAEAIDGLVRKWLAGSRTRSPPRTGPRGIATSSLSFGWALVGFFPSGILDIGRPDRVALIFARQVRRNTPGRFRTRVITDTVTPSLHIDYKHCQIKQYHKHGRALRTETTINDTYDFAIGRRLTNLPALREIGFSANRRLLRVQRLSHDPTDGTDAWPRSPARSPPTPGSGCRAAVHRPPRQALLSAICVFRLLPAASPPRPTPPPGAPARTLTRVHDQRADHLRPTPAPLHGLIDRIPHTHRYHVTDTGLRPRCSSPRHNRLLRPGSPRSTATRPDQTPRRHHRYEHAIDSSPSSRTRPDRAAELDCEVVLPPVAARRGDRQADLRHS